MECREESDILEKCSDADVICSELRSVSPETMDGLKNCKALIKYGIGYDIAALDIFEDEPLISKDHPFYHMDNVIMTPHAAFVSVESTPELCRLTAVTSVKVLRNEYLDNLVNRKQLIENGFMSE